MQQTDIPVLIPNTPSPPGSRGATFRLSKDPHHRQVTPTPTYLVEHFVFQQTVYGLFQFCGCFQPSGKSGFLFGFLLPQTLHHLSGSPTLLTLFILLTLLSFFPAIIALIAPTTRRLTTMSDRTRETPRGLCAIKQKQ